LPVLVNGRLKPLDTVARSSLLQLQSRQRVSSPKISEPLVASPIEWLLEVMFRPERADTFPTFTIDNPDLLTLVGKTEENLKIQYDSTAKKILSIVGFIPSHYRRFSLQELTPHIAAIQAQARLAEPVEAAVRTPFQRAVMQLYHNLVHYQRLRHALVAPGREDFLGDLLKFQENVAAGVTAVRAREAGQPHDQAAVTAMTEIGERFVIMAESTNFLVIPPPPDVTDPTAWKPAGAALLETFRTGQVNPSALAYAGFAHAWRNNKPEQFNKLLELFRADLARRFEPQLKKCAAEARFNAAQPFYTSMTLYAVAFFVAILSWLAWPQALGRAAFWFVAVAWIVATAGIATRMWLEGRPPVTNLYSSALFICWGAVGLCLVLEHFFRNAIGSAAAGVIGFATLLIAHHLSLSGDTLEMMRAVLDSNFWLATHVVVVTSGYSATFLAGFLALIYILRGLFTKTLDKVTADALSRMVYGIVCFATLFSFVGTILGGIWADQSWGRFWGWDPKENGALIIVIWNAIILHARWGGMVKQRGLMCLAVGGNIATAWSWFGTNMLGVGLHSYGFTDAAFVALIVFAISQILIIALANLPLHKWRSFKSRDGSGTAAKLPRVPHKEKVLTS
jgi:ABC-type transport system involved in cytochrome c biogenesis permease subunit